MNGICIHSFIFLFHTRIHQGSFESSNCRFRLATISERSSWCKSFLFLLHYHPKIRLHHWITRRLCFLSSRDLFSRLWFVLSTNLKVGKERTVLILDPIISLCARTVFLIHWEKKCGLWRVMKTAQRLWLARNGNWTLWTTKLRSVLRDSPRSILIAHFTQVKSGNARDITSWLMSVSISAAAQYSWPQWNLCPTVTLGTDESVRCRDG